MTSLHWSSMDSAGPHTTFLGNLFLHLLYLQLATCFCESSHQEMQICASYGLPFVYSVHHHLILLTCNVPATHDPSAPSHCTELPLLRPSETVLLAPRHFSTGAQGRAGAAERAAAEDKHEPAAASARWHGVCPGPQLCTAPTAAADLQTLR